MNVPLLRAPKPRDYFQIWFLGQAHGNKCLVRPSARQILSNREGSQTWTHKESFPYCDCWVQRRRWEARCCFHAYISLFFNTCLFLFPKSLISKRAFKGHTQWSQSRLHFYPKQPMWQESPKGASHVDSHLEAQHLDAGTGFLWVQVQPGLQNAF